MKDLHTAAFNRWHIYGIKLIWLYTGTHICMYIKLYLEHRGKYKAEIKIGHHYSTEGILERAGSGLKRGNRRWSRTFHLYQQSFSSLWCFIGGNPTCGFMSREVSVAEKHKSWKTAFKSHHETVSGLWDEQFRAMHNNMGEPLYSSSYRKYESRQNEAMLLEVKIVVTRPCK